MPPTEKHPDIRVIHLSNCDVKLSRIKNNAGDSEVYSVYMDAFKKLEGLSGYVTGPLCRHLDNVVRGAMASFGILKQQISTSYSYNGKQFDSVTIKIPCEVFSTRDVGDDDAFEMLSLAATEFISVLCTRNTFKSEPLTEAEKIEIKHGVVYDPYRDIDRNFVQCFVEHSVDKRLSDSEANLLVDRVIELAKKCNVIGVDNAKVTYDPGNKAIDNYSMLEMFIDTPCANTTRDEQATNTLLFARFCTKLRSSGILNMMLK